MRRKFLLDTSFVIAFLFEKDKYHPQAVKIFKHLPDNAELYIHELVFQESATVICRRCKERKIDCSFALKVFQEFTEKL
ncbi:MAG: hypothetical protein DSZ30_02420, partial [Aquificaceae bacterium]